MKTLITIFCILSILIGLLMLIGSPVGWVFLSAGIIVLFLTSKSLNTKDDVKSNDTIAEAPEPLPWPEEQEVAESPAKAGPPISEFIPAAKPRKNIPETHRVAGVSHYSDNLLSLAKVNPVYDSTKRELIDFGLDGERVYEYSFPSGPVELIPEPENEFDPKAVKVILAGAHVGYIKKGSTGRIRNLLKADRIRGIDAEVYGGKYKYVDVYEDDNGKEKSTMEHHTIDYGIALTVFVAPEE